MCPRFLVLSSLFLLPACSTSSTPSLTTVAQATTPSDAPSEQGNGCAFEVRYKDTDADSDLDGCYVERAAGTTFCPPFWRKYDFSTSPLPQPLVNLFFNAANDELSRLMMHDTAAYFALAARITKATNAPPGAFHSINPTSLFIPIRAGFDPDPNAINVGLLPSTLLGGTGQMGTPCDVGAWTRFFFDSIHIPETIEQTYMMARLSKKQCAELDIAPQTVKKVNNVNAIQFSDPRSTYVWRVYNAIFDAFVSDVRALCGDNAITL